MVNTWLPQNILVQAKYNFSWGANPQVWAWHKSQLLLIITFGVRISHILHEQPATGAGMITVLMPNIWEVLGRMLLDRGVMLVTKSVLDTASGSEVD